MNDAARKIISVALTGMLMLSALAVTAMPSTVSADIVLPTSFYGNVTVNGVAAPVNTTVTGKIVGAVGSPGNGSITTTVVGKYGGPAGGDPKLAIQTNDDDDVGKTIEFYVQLPSWGAAAKANETGTYDHAPTAHNVDLTVTAVTATLEGHVSFPGRGSAPCGTWIQPFNVTLFEPGNLSHVLWTGSATTNNTGVFTVSGLSPGIYDISIKNCTCLSELVSNQTLAAGNTTVVDFGTTREGDCYEDDWVTGKDRNLLYTGWGTHEGVIGWDPRCDLNRDGWLTGKDRNLMYTYWDGKQKRPQ